MNEIPTLTEIIQMDLEELSKVQNILKRVDFVLQRAIKNVRQEIFSKECEARGGITLDDIESLEEVRA